MTTSEVETDPKKVLLNLLDDISDKLMAVSVDMRPEYLFGKGTGCNIDSIWNGMANVKIFLPKFSYEFYISTKFKEETEYVLFKKHSEYVTEGILNTSNVSIERLSVIDYMITNDQEMVKELQRIIKQIFMAIEDVTQTPLPPELYEYL